LNFHPYYFCRSDLTSSSFIPSICDSDSCGFCDISEPTIAIPAILLFSEFIDLSSQQSRQKPRVLTATERNFLLERIGQKLRCFFDVVAYRLRWLLHLNALFFAVFRRSVAFKVARLVVL
jgi:hypothetical protein